MTGATGLSAERFARIWVTRGHDVGTLVRRLAQVESLTTQVTIPDDNFASLATGDPDSGGCDVVIRLAARGHVMRNKNAEPIVAYWASNEEGCPVER